MHGNSEDIGMNAAFLQALAASVPAIVVAVEYPGFGPAPGSPTESSVNRAVRRAFDYVHNYHGVPASDIVLFGRSIGGGPAVELAASLEEEGINVRGLVMVVSRVLFDKRRSLC
jgi:hypothetical protein